MILHGNIAAICLLVIQVAFAENGKLHELLTDEEFYKVFRTTRDDVPEYEVVPIRHDLYKRSSNNLRMQFSAFGKDVDIHLNPADGILARENTPVWLASPGANGKINYRQMTPNIVGLISKTFVGPRAAVVVDKSNGKPRFEGTIGDTTIVSWPASVQEVTKKEFEKAKREATQWPATVQEVTKEQFNNFKENSTESWPATVQEVTKEDFKKLKREVSSRTLIPTDYHVIIKTKASSDNILAEKQVEKIVNNYNQTDGGRIKRYTSETIYPSVFIVTDYSGTPTSGEENRFYDEVRYQLAFWNSVDLRYRDLQNPKVRLRIAGIVIGQGRSATPYVQKHMKGDKLEVYGALLSTAQYWDKETSNPNFASDKYDIIITLTDATLYDKDDPKNRPVGLATMESLCHAPSGYHYDAVGVVNDDKKFDGVVIATHEIGHILGAQHDVNSNGPCATNLGYIMAPSKMHTLKMNHWSTCSLKRIEAILGLDRNCADDPSDVHNHGNPIGRIAPGEIRNAQTQCEDHRFSWACDPTPKTCKKLQCWYGGIYGIGTNWQCQNAPVGALDGTPCAPDAICVRGECRRGDQIID